MTFFSAASLYSLTPRIVGGSVVSSIEDVPYQVSVRLNDQHHCGGIIISKNYVLTAAACVISGTLNQYTIRAGSLINNYGGTLHQISRIIRHEQFYINNLNIPVNDIALIQVSSPFIFDGSRDAVPLVEQPARVGSVARISGWGWMNSTFPLQLRRASVQLIDTRVCNNKYGGNVPPNQICAYTRGQDACQADAGGPLVVGLRLAGIISWGKGCALQNYPGVFTDVYAYRNWITFYTGVISQ